MDEHDLRTLAHDPAGPAEQRRPLEAVLRRSRQLQLRRSAVRAAGAGFLIAGLLGAGAVVRSPGRDHAQGDVATEPPVLPELCPGSMPDEPEPSELSDVSDPIPAAEAADLLFLPPGLQITAASAWQHEVSCWMDPLLALQTDGGDGTIDGTIKLTGPFGDPVERAFDEDQVETPTRVRGVAATRIAVTGAGGSAGEQALLAFTWTDAAGASWVVESLDADEATVRAVIDALLLDSTGRPGRPPADIPDDALPRGWEKTWSAPTFPVAAAEGDPMRWWMVELIGPPPGCDLEVRSGLPTDAPVRAFAGPGDQLLTVRGQEARRIGERGLEWTEPDGVHVVVSCDGTAPNIEVMAETLEHVSPDDPRLDVPRIEVAQPP